MRTLTALTLATGLALSSASAAVAMTDEEMISMGQSMLTGALYNSLSARGYQTDGIEKLTLNEVVLLRSLLESDDASGAAGQISLIFDQAKTR